MTSNTATSQLEEWFDELVASLRSHQVQLESKVATEELGNFYKTLMEGNTNEIAHMSKIQAQKYFVSAIIFEYLNQIKGFFPKKLAFDFNDAEVLVWAETEDDNEQQEKELIMAEARVNSKFHPFGFDMSSTIVEESDNLEVPNHYRLFK